MLIIKNPEDPKTKLPCKFIEYYMMPPSKKGNYSNHSCLLGYQIISLCIPQGIRQFCLSLSHNCQEFRAPKSAILPSQLPSISFC